MTKTKPRSKSKIKVFIVACEASGDRLGAKLMQATKAQLNGDVEFHGIGGKFMRAEGLQLADSAENFGIIGFSGILLHLFRLASLLNRLAAYAEAYKPDLVITIDSWDFASRLVRKLRRSEQLANTKFAHYISPSVWIYRAGRIKQVQQLYDQLLCIFPFEPTLYAHTGMNCQYVGHPLVEDFDAEISSADFKSEHSIPKGAKILGAMVGSRPSEIKRLLPIFAEAIELFLAKFPQKKFTVVFPAINAAAAKLIERSRTSFDKLVVNVADLSPKMRTSMLKSFDLACAKSGTTTVELALARVPMVVAYKVDMVSKLIAKYVFALHRSIKHACMVNILLGEPVVQEFIQENCDPKLIAAGLQELMSSAARKKLLLNYSKVGKMLSIQEKHTPSQLAAKHLLALLR